MEHRGGQHLRHAGWLALAAAVACGGKAVLDDPLAAAGGSASSSSSSGSSGRCVKVCDMLAGCLQTPGCAGRCTALGPSCKSEQDALLQCLMGEQVAQYPCNLPDVCFVQLYDFAGCLGHHQIGGQCGGPVDGECSCTVQDAKGKSYAMQCTSDGGVQSCVCRDDGEIIGSCTQPGFNECQPYSDCCATLLFVPGP